MAIALGTSATDLRVGSSSISRMAKGGTAFWDADAADYVSRVQAADGEPLELGIVAAYHAFCLGCKDDGIWDAIKACCVMAGARTIAGALVPLKRPYGPELVDIDALPTPSVTTSPSVGLTVAWDGETRTLSVTSPGTTSDRPAVVFPVGMVSGKRYRIEGRLSGDTARAFNVGAGSGQWAAYNQSTGEFSGVLRASGTYFWMYVDGRQASSITIESLSIREDSFTPTAYPQPVNFVSGDYSRSLGLKGDGSTKYIDSNRANDADGQDDKHIAFYAEADSASGYMGSLIRSPSVVPTQLYAGTDVVRGYVNNETATSRTYTGGFAGTQRIDSTTVELRSSDATIETTGIPSIAGNSLNTFVFARNDVGTANAFTDARISFYSIGASLDLALLDAKVSALMSQIAAALA